MSRQGDLVKVLTLIDESLSDLNSAAAQKQQITSLPASFSSTTYLNTLTRDLLEQQKQNATLLEENEVLRRRLHMQGGSTALVSNSTTDPTQYNDYTTTTTYKDALSTTIAQCITTINTKVDQQAELLHAKQVDGMCSLSHADVQASLNRCLAQLQRFRESEMIAKQQRNDLFVSAERDRDKLAAAMLEIQHLQGVRRGMEERLEAFELENMRLTNDLSRERECTNGANEFVKDSQMDMLNSKNEKTLLLQEIDTLKNQNYRLVNEVDEIRNLQQGL